jgi:ZIP family zinc transporter
MLQLIAFEFLSITSENAQAFMLSFWASMGTFLGGLLVVLVVGLLGADPKASSTSRLMGILQSVAAGVMIHMTSFHLVPESTASIGARETMIFFFAGVVLFAFLELIVMPVAHNHDMEHHQHHHLDKTETPVKAKGTRSTRSSSKKIQKEKDTSLNQPVANISHTDAADLYRTSLITFIAMALHNIPEGISVYLTALSNPKLGMQMALAIMLHNGIIRLSLITLQC